MSKITKWAEIWLNLRPPVCDPLPYTVRLLPSIHKVMFFAMEMMLLYRWGCASSFLLYLSELSFIIGITTEKINTAADNIYLQFLVGLPCKPGSPVRIPTKTLGAISGFSLLVIWGQLPGLAAVCRVIRQNCRISSLSLGLIWKLIVLVVVHGNLAWDFTMLAEGIKHQQDKNNNKNSQCSIFGLNSMALYYSHLQEHWQTLLPTFLSLSDSVSPTNITSSWACFQSISLSPPRGSHVFHRTELPGFDLDEEVFPMSTQRKVSPMWRKWTSSTFLTSLSRKTGSVLPLWRVLVFSSSIACL